jgi:hypothetical protein
VDEKSKRRLAELHAAAPPRRKKTKPFAILDLTEASRAYAAMNCHKAMVYTWLVHQARKTGKWTVDVPNGILSKYGVTRKTKTRALNRLAAAGIITIEKSPRKTPRVTLL